MENFRAGSPGLLLQAKWWLPVGRAVLNGRRLLRVPQGLPESSRGREGCIQPWGAALCCKIPAGLVPCPGVGCGLAWVGLLMDTVLPRGSQATVGAPGRHRLLEKELRELQAAERQLDDLIQMCTVQLRLLTEDPANQQYPLVLGWGCLGGAVVEPRCHRQGVSQPTSPCPFLDLPHRSLCHLPGPPQHCGPRGANGDGYQSPPRDPAAGLRPSRGELGTRSAPAVPSLNSPGCSLGVLVPPRLTPVPFPRRSRSPCEALRAPSMCSSAPRTAPGSAAPSRAPSKPLQRTLLPAIPRPEPPCSCILPRM